MPAVERRPLWHMRKDAKKEKTQSVTNKMQSARSTKSWKLKLAGAGLVIFVLLSLVFLAGSSSYAVSRNIEQVLAAGTTTREGTNWSEDDAPNYVLLRGPAEIDLEARSGTVFYSPLDPLGRAGRVVACIDFEMMQAGLERPRGELSNIRPSGWGHNAEVEIALPESDSSGESSGEPKRDSSGEPAGESSTDSSGEYYHGYFWNRSHLLAKSLGGGDTKENLICGTRMQNVGANDGKGGMAYVEGMVRDWLFEHKDGFVYYLVTPVYQGQELVARSVVVDLRSSDGSLDAQYEVFNTAYGFEINYATGEFEATSAELESD